MSGYDEWKPMVLVGELRVVEADRAREIDHLEIERRDGIRTPISHSLRLWCNRGERAFPAFSAGKVRITVERIE